MLFFKTIKVPFSWRVMGETHAWETLDILMSDFFVKDKIYKGEVRVEYFPTHLMLA